MVNSIMGRLRTEYRHKVTGLLTLADQAHHLLVNRNPVRELLHLRVRSAVHQIKVPMEIKVPTGVKVLTGIQVLTGMPADNELSGPGQRHEAPSCEGQGTRKSCSTFAIRCFCGVKSQLPVCTGD